jgi:hypothetical protein
MKNLIVVLVLVASAFAADVRRAGATVYGRLETNAAFNAVNNNYIMDLVSSGAGVCFSFFNPDGATHNLNVTAFITSDPNNVTYTGNTANWVQVPVTPAPTGAGGSTTYTFAAAATTQLYVRTSGGFHLTMVFSGGAGGTGVTIFFAQTGSPCGSNFQWAVSCIDAACTGPANTSIVAAVSGVRHVASCVAGSSRNGGTASTATFVIRDGGSAANCTTGTILWQAIVTTPATIGASQQIAVCGLNVAASPGATLQLCSTNIVAAENQRASMSGYDTQ